MRDYLNQKHELTFKPDLSLTRSGLIRYISKSSSLDRLKEVKGAEKTVNRIRLGNLLQKIENESREKGLHVNDGGIKILQGLSKDRALSLPQNY